LIEARAVFFIRVQYSAGGGAGRGGCLKDTAGTGEATRLRADVAADPQRSG